MFRRCARAGRPVAEGPRGRRDPDVVRRGAGEGAPLAAGLAATPRVLRHRRVTERRRGLGHVRVRTAARVKRLDLVAVERVLRAPDIRVLSRVGPHRGDRYEVEAPGALAAQDPEPDLVVRVVGPGEVDLAGRHRGSGEVARRSRRDRKSTRLNSSHTVISYAVFCLKKKKKKEK